jgi:alkylhydroperoxidase family enzyme
MAPRIKPVTQDEISDDLRPLLHQIAVTGQFVPNVSTTFAHNPGLFRPFLGFGEHFITRSGLPERERELAVCRTAFLSGSEYMFAHHAIIAKTGGLTDAELDRIKEGPQADGWSEDDRQILRITDELHARHDLTDASWQFLADRWTHEQIVEYLLAVGFYTMSAMALNAIRVELEPEITGGVDKRLGKEATAA